MKYIINESRIEDLMIRYLDKYLGEYKEFRKRGPGEFEGFYSDEGFKGGFFVENYINGLVMDEGGFVMNSSTFEVISKLFGIKSTDLMPFILHYINAKYPKLNVKHFSRINLNVS